MTKLQNPFPIEGYAGSEYFCDRVEETKDLLSALANGRNVTLISPRRMGKSGLIKHMFEIVSREQPEIACFYFDIFHTKNLNDFIQLFATNIIGALDSNIEKLLSEVVRIFKNSRPTLTPDEVTGIPTLSLDIVQGKEEHTLKEIFDYLKDSGKRCYIAIDEFQQINEYPEKGTEALIRSYIQFLPNVSFVFSGSRKHLMQDMFTSPKRPFYQSTQTLPLREINEKEYCKFAQGFFSSTGRKLPEECFHYIYESVMGHTWYIQSWLNRLYEIAEGDVTMSEVRLALEKKLREEDDNFYTYYRTLTPSQRKVIEGIAREQVVDKPLASAFIKEHNLPATSTVKSCIASLLDNEFLIEERGELSVYNRFFMLWLRK